MCTEAFILYIGKVRVVDGRTKMWDVFLNDMGINNTFELALAKLDLNKLVLELVTVDDGIGD
jgi:hypothetical protein